MVGQVAVLGVGVPHADPRQFSRLIGNAAVAFRGRLEHDAAIDDLDFAHRAVGGARDVEDAVDMLERRLCGETVHGRLGAGQKPAVGHRARLDAFVVALPGGVFKEKPPRWGGAPARRGSAQ